MIFTPTPIAGAYLIDPEPIEDERGFFARTWCRKEFAEHGLSAELAQCSISFNRKKGTLRGMHYQVPPHLEAKLVCCTRGALYDVALDLRPQSPTFRVWKAFELTERNRRMLYIPAGCAHGFQTLEDNTEVCYQISEHYHPESARRALERPGVWDFLALARADSFGERPVLSGMANVIALEGNDDDSSH